jgi:phosphoglucomutase
MPHALAGKPVPPELVMDAAKLERSYYELKPDLDNPKHAVAFGTSGHRGTPFDGSFTEPHILAITQAICEYRAAQGITGPLFMGRDTHAASAPAQRSALEVLAANGVHTYVQQDDGYAPTPVISRAILTYNAGREAGLADGIIITPSHNPPEDGGFKYNPPNGGPADTDITGWVQKRANAILRDGLRDVKRIPYERALTADTTHRIDYAPEYVRDLGSVLSMDALKASGLRIGIDPLGGASAGYWAVVAEMFGLNITVVNTRIDPTFSFMTLDHDGKIRMDCSSPFAMAGLVGLKDDFDIAFGCDPDSDRHGIVTPSGGLMNPNHYLAVAIDHLVRTRFNWSPHVAVGKTMVSSTQIDRVVSSLERTLFEVPVGFKFFAPGLFDGTVVFGGEESAGASFVRRDGSPWSTDKDGLILGLLAAEITAITGADPSARYRALEAQFGPTYYTRQDTPSTPAEKKALAALSADSVKADTLAGDAITGRLTHAPGNGAALGGLKVTSEGGWFAARPSGTEDIYKLYAESYRGGEHLDAIVAEARALVSAAIGHKP